MSSRKEQLEKESAKIRAEINDIEEKAWVEKEEPLYKQFVGHCEGESKKRTKKDDGYLFYRKYIAYLGERTFLVIEVNTHTDRDDGSLRNQHIAKKTEFFYHAEQLGKYYPKVKEEEFQKAYRQVLSQISL